MRTSPRQILRSLAVSLAVAVLTACAVYIISYFLFPVTGVSVEGARMYPEADAWRGIPDNASLLTLNASTLQRQVESNPWVESAEVSKNWDSGIVAVEVEERRAVIDAEIGGSSAAYALDGTRLPGLGGAKLQKVVTDRIGLGEILESGRVLERNGVGFDSVDAVGPGGVEATVEGRRIIFSYDVEEAQARALGNIMEAHPDAPGFDLRSSRRVVVAARGA